MTTDGSRIKKILTKISRTIGWLIFSVFVLLIGIIFAIRIPAVQNRIAQKAITYLEGKIKTKVSLESITITFPKKVVIEKLYVEDQAKDTLLYAGRLAVDLSMMGLLDDEITLNTVELSNTTANIQRTLPDSSFNYDYIMDAFADSDTIAQQPTDTAAVAWKFSLGTVEVEKIKFRYDDDVSLIHVAAKLGQLNASSDEFDPIQSVFLFDDITVTDSKVRVTIESRPAPTQALTQSARNALQKDTPGPPSSSTSSPPDTSALQIRAGFQQLRLRNVEVSYSDTGSGQELNTRIGEVAIEADNIDLTGRSVSLDNVDVSNTFVAFHQSGDSAQNVQAVDSLTTTTENLALSPWAVTVAKLNLKDNNVQYENFGTKSSNLPFDPNHIWLMGLNITASNIRIDDSEASIELNTMSFREKKGMELKSLSGDAKLGQTEATLRNLKLEFGRSNLNFDGKMTYPNFAALTTDLSKVTAQIAVSQTSVYTGDILFFQPHLLDSLPVKIPADSKMDLNIRAEGSMAQATIDQFELRTLDSTYLSLNGTARGLADLKTSSIDGRLQQFYTSKNDVIHILPDSLLPATVSLPSYLKLTGTVNGGVKQPLINLTLTTDKGILKGDAKLDIINTPTYSIHLAADDLHAGALSGVPTLGNLSFKFKAEGKGFTMDDIHTRVDLVITELIYNNYRFADFNLHGTIDKYFFSGVAALNDKNLDFELNADLDYNGDTPTYKAEFDLKNLDLKELNLSERPLRTRLTVAADLTTKDFRMMNGHLDIRKVAVFNGTKLYAVDSMLVATVDQQGESKVTIRSDILTGNFQGSFNIFSISEVLQHHFERYFSKNGETYDPGPPQNFTFDLTIKNTDLITEVLVPELEPFTPGIIKGGFDSERHTLDLVFKMPTLQYGTTGVDSLVVLINSNDEALDYLLKLDNLKADTIKIDQVNLTGRVAHDSIRTDFSILDSLSEKKYAMGARIRRDGSLMQIHLTDGLILNYSPWNVPEGNYLAIGNGVIAANEFQIIKKNQKVIMVGDTRKDPAITIQFEDLEIGNLTRIISGVVPASGELNGDFKFTTAKSGEFSSKLSIAGLTVLKKPLGDLTFGIQHSGSQYNLDLHLLGNKTSLEAKGTYGGARGNEALDLDIDISQLNMEAVEPFTLGQVKNAVGIVQGKVTVKGNPSHPDVNGDLNFKEVSFTSTYLNNKFELKNENISIKGDDITLSNFTISDEQNNTAQLKGKINIEEYSNPQFDLTLVTREFQILNTTEDDNDLYYGKVKINTTARISGNAQVPRAIVKLSFSDDTNFTYVVPSTEKGVLESKGIVKWVDKDALADPFLSSLNTSDSVRSSFSGIEVSATIDLTDKETLNVVIDPISGDKLIVQGNSSLTFDMTSSGNMNLSGRYEISKGTYNISFYNLVKRKFDIEKGSTITWSGDPLNAAMDIRASNLVETSPIDLLPTQDPGAVAANNYNQRLPFLVYLNIKGALLTPQISFSLDMPPDKRNAYGGILYSKLQDINSRESDLNKQVFALLILKRFVADNPFESQNSSGLSSTARTSVSRVLSEQLKQVKSKM